MKLFLRISLRFEQKMYTFAPGFKQCKCKYETIHDDSSLSLVFAMPAFAQGINDKADNIVGEYLTDRGGSKSKVRVTKSADGTYSAQVF